VGEVANKHKLTPEDSAVEAGDKQIVGFLLSGGNVTDAQAGLLLLVTLTYSPFPVFNATILLCIHL